MEVIGVLMGKISLPRGLIDLWRSIYLFCGSHNYVV
jgi:hypothetical protein